MRPTVYLRAFTIVELLVCLSVTALLVGLLFPALAGSAAAGRAALCQANLRHMSMAASAYAALHDAYPPAIRYEIVNGTLHRFAWDWVTTASGQLVSPGPLWSFTDNPDAVQQCPDCTASATFTGDPYTGYNYNTSYLGAEGFQSQPGWNGMRRGVPPHACARASSCVMFGDGGWKHGANKFMRAPANHEFASLGVIYGGGQAFRHRGRSNASFIDGHVASFNTPFVGQHSTPTLLSQIMDFPRNGFLGPDDRLYNPR